MPRLVASRQSAFSHLLPNPRLQRLHTPFRKLVEPTLEEQFVDPDEIDITVLEHSTSQGPFAPIGSRLRPVGVITNEDEYNEFDDPILHDANQLVASIQNETSRELEDRQGKKNAARYNYIHYSTLIYVEFYLV